MSVLAMRRINCAFDEQSGLRRFLLRIDEWLLDHNRLPRTDRRHDFDFGTELRQVNRQPGIPDVLLEARRHRERGQGSDLFAILLDGPWMREPGPDDLVTQDLDSDELFLRTLFLDLSQRRSADEVVFLVQIDEPSQTSLVRVVIPIDVRRIVQDPGLDPAVLGGTSGPKGERLPGRHDAVPQIGSSRSVAQIDLVSDLGGPSRPRNDYRDAIDCSLEKGVVFQIRDRWAHERAEHILRFRSLDLHRRDVGFSDLDVEVGMVGDAFRPEEHIAIRGLEPKSVLPDSREHGVIDEPTLLVRQEYVLGLADLARGEVPRRQVLHELVSVGTPNLHLTFASDVPDGRMIHEMPVFLDRIGEIARDVHLVVHVVRAATGAPGRVKERRFPVPGTEEERRLPAFDDHAKSPPLPGGMASAYLTAIVALEGGNSKKAGPFPNLEGQPVADLWKPEHVGSAPHGPGAAARRFVRRGGPEAVGICRETRPRRGSARARSARRSADAIRGRRSLS